MASLPPHAILRLQLGVVTIDNWASSDTFTVLVDGVRLGAFTRTDASASVVEGVWVGNLCGAPANPQGLPGDLACSRVCAVALLLRDPSWCVCFGWFGRRGWLAVWLVFYCARWVLVTGVSAGRAWIVV